MTLALIVIAIFALVLSSTPFVLGRGDFWDGLDAVVLARLESLRSDTLTSVARELNAFTDAWVLLSLIHI